MFSIQFHAKHLDNICTFDIDICIIYCAVNHGIKDDPLINHGTRELTEIVRQVPTRLMVGLRILSNCVAALIIISEPWPTR